MTTSEFLDQTPMPAEKYNALPHIVDAKELSSTQIGARNELLRLIASYGLEGIFSIHLVHKHFTIPDGRVMVYETVRGTRHADFQMSSPRLPSEYNNRKGLYFQAVKDGKLAGYEYKTDPLLDVSPHNKFLRRYLKGSWI
jgi:hypothetical protein